MIYQLCDLFASALSGSNSGERVERVVVYILEIGKKTNSENTMSTKEIKNAYKNLTKFYHPDIKETGSTEKMQEINIAYKTLFNQELYNQEIEELKKNPEKYQQIRANFPILFEEETNSDNTSNNTNTNQQQQNK